ncbi:MAG: InlB B-repeat-containing protein [Coriobacteriia bacterium]|nr:InlB B-repeat-containing protein [Coriobacteriia bacterium]
MAVNSANVGVGKPKATGAIWLAPKGTPLPSSATDDLEALGYSCLGYGASDGLKNPRSKNTNKMKAWGGNVVRITSDEYEETYSFGLIETIVPVLKAYFGDDNVSVDSATGKISVYSCGDDLPIMTWVFDIVLNDDMIERIIVQEGQITEFEDMEYTDEDPVKYGVTVSSYPSEIDGHVSNSKRIVEASHYTVVFDKNGHGKAPAAQRVVAGAHATEPTDPTETGFTFGGWFKETACTNEWDFDTDPVVSNMTLYAKWTPVTNKKK